MNYWFFFSYAHADDNEYLRKFYTDLDGEVRQLTGAPKEQIGFLDRKDIEHGATWDVRLEQGLKNCQVFVPLYSPSLFRSPYCGKEFAVFRDRLHSHLSAAGEATNDSLVLPVLWNSEKNVLPEIPEVIKKIQYAHGSYPAEYWDLGVLQIVRHASVKNAAYFTPYWDFVSKFASTIVAAAATLALPAQTSNLASLENAVSLFSPVTPVPPVPSGTETGPRYVQFIFVAGKQPELQAARQDLRFYGQLGGSDWQPYLDTYKGNASALAIEAIEAISKDLHYEEVTLTAGIDQQVKLAASEEKIVVVMVDTWTLRLQKYNQLIAPLDQYSSVNCITLIVWNDEDQEATIFKGALEAAVKGAFNTKAVQNPPNFLSTSIKSYETFKTELIKALGQAQAQIIETAKIKKNLEYALVKTPDTEFVTKPSL
ncbi:MAG TPA: TIR-like protein FxsC [Pyrinomonadaceae bacterium]|nr:TIR-like protein FxsC [Pyrinomonadaceae bacterium]